MRATSLSSPHHLAQHAESVSYLIPFFRIAVRRLSGWDLRVTLVCGARLVAFLILRCNFFLDTPCTITEVPAVDAIVLSVCLLHLHKL